jgi:APA family basic amino acid/polyamine antiporter
VTCAGCTRGHCSAPSWWPAWDLGDLANAVVLLLLLVFLSTNVAVLVLRRDRVEQKHFRAPAVLPVLAIASCLLLLWQQEGRTCLLAGAELAVGVLLYLLTRAPWWRTGDEPAPMTAGSSR